ncbi:MAG: hypothetical protein OXI83_02950 [Gemmatimonadota bacterium]|nr:hypothetical protein [Gemmatimonadota bacterium]
MTAIGLALDIVGVILLFFYGPPPGILSTTPGTMVLYGAADEEKQQREINRHLWLSRIALGVIVTGFGLQFWDAAFR